MKWIRYNESNFHYCIMYYNLRLQNVTGYHLAEVIVQIHENCF